MHIIKPNVTLQTKLSGIEILKSIEEAARTCYKSEDKITETSYIALIEGLIRRDHLAMIEFGDMIAKFICDRGVTHEIVRHRLFSFAQESTRYCDYSRDKFDNQITFIDPCYWNEKLFKDG
jgi:thymidylate synthase (FAD)